MTQKDEYLGHNWLCQLRATTKFERGRKFHRTLQKRPSIRMKQECMITQRWTQEGVIQALTYLNK